MSLLFLFLQLRWGPFATRTVFKNKNLECQSPDHFLQLLNPYSSLISSFVLMSNAALFSRLFWKVHVILFIHASAVERASSSINSMTVLLPRFWALSTFNVKLCTKIICSCSTSTIVVSLGYFLACALFTVFFTNSFSHYIWAEITRRRC